MNGPTRARPDRSVWPEPEAEAVEHSERVTAAVERAIEAGQGWIDFQAYMDLVLYAPALGYYSAGACKIGPDGDFVTAPEVSDIFSRCLARQCAEVMQAIAGADILELGAGTGTMAVDVLLELEQLGSLPDRYLILEPSPQLRQRQQETVAARAPWLAARLQWLTELPDESIRGVVLANEVLDAMPVRCFAVRGQEVKERGVGLISGGLGWVEREVDAQLDDDVRRVLGDAVQDLPEGYCSELNPNLAPWLRSIGRVLETGAVVLIDYGYPRREYYAPERTQGTLLCHYRHRVHADPFLWPGLQDITASVDFTAVAEAGVDEGFTLNGFTTQAYFLMSNGLEEIYQTKLDANPERIYELSQQIQRLTLPGEMGERVLALALTKGLDLQLRGFTLRDFSHRL